ncbi:MAG: PTS fructose transporter subunit IIA [Lachnospiraceae bacterium]|nr:PTS fructose transporter subunit IIA [Lachnospiraceae bacterium]
MRKLLIATHGRFAAGIKETLNFILGDATNTQALCAYVEPGFDMEKAVDKAISDLNEDDELIVSVDIFGGSVCNAFSTRITDSRVFIISGVNFPMLLDIANSLDSATDTRNLINSAINAGKEGIINVNDVMLQASECEEEDDFK